MMSIQKFLWILFLLPILISGCRSTHGATSSSESLRPNILVLISDDHSADAIGVVGEKGGPKTPALDSLAAAGVLFANAYVASPQCSPSRAALVTGRSPHATGTSRLHSALRTEYPSVIDALRESGYYVAALRKVHLGENFQSRWNFYGGDEVPFEQFFRDRPRDRPFFLWVGFHDPHRPYERSSTSPKHNPAQVRVPGFLPDTEAVRRDIADYYDEIARMDTEVARILALLETEKLARNTLVVFAGDNGMPFPGAKGSLYDAGVRVPLILRWPSRIPPGKVHKEVVSLLDLAPTWLEAAGVKTLPAFEGRSLLKTFTTGVASEHRPAFFERNWHDNLDLIRGVRSGRHLLIQNFRPELPYTPTLDLADSPTWKVLLHLHQQQALSPSLELRYFSKSRPQTELYDVEADPFGLQDLASDPAHAKNVRALQELLSNWMVATNDFLPPPIPPKRGEQGESIHP